MNEDSFDGNFSETLEQIIGDDLLGEVVFGKGVGRSVSYFEWEEHKNNKKHWEFLSIGEERINEFVNICRSLEVDKLIFSIVSFKITSYAILNDYFRRLPNNALMRTMIQNTDRILSTIRVLDDFISRFKFCDEDVKTGLLTSLEKHFNAGYSSEVNLLFRVNIACAKLKYFMECEKQVKQTESLVPSLYELSDEAAEDHLIVDTLEAISTYHELLLDFINVIDVVNVELVGFLRKYYP